LEWNSPYCIPSKRFFECCSYRFTRSILSNNLLDILHLHSKKVDTYKGNFDNFENVRYERLLQQQRAHDAQQVKRCFLGVELFSETNQTCANIY
jgi:hypothetical protein